MDWRGIVLAFLVITVMRHSDSSTHAAQIFQQPLTSTAAIASTVQIECASESIIVHISTEHNTDFHGLVYPRGLSKNSSCLQEYRSQPVPITYNLPLRSCNTMPTELGHLKAFRKGEGRGRTITIHGRSLSVHSRRISTVGETRFLYGT